jgi:hypothetical protein
MPTQAGQQTPIIGENSTTEVAGLDFEDDLTLDAIRRIFPGREKVPGWKPDITTLQPAANSRPINTDIDDNNNECTIDPTITISHQPGGRLQQYNVQWKALTPYLWPYSVVSQSCQLQFYTKPNPWRTTPLLFNTQEQATVDKEIKTYLKQVSSNEVLHKIVHSYRLSSQYKNQRRDDRS